MMALLDLSFIDVGHGNCALVIDGSAVVVVDAPIGDILVETLEHHGIKTIDLILISHADADHIGGVMTPLLDKNFHVREVFVNPDASKGTDIWNDLRVAVAQARKSRKTAVQTQLTTQSKLPATKRLKLQVLSPSPEIAMGGPGSTDLKGRRLTSNSMSAVVRLLQGDDPVAVLAGDLDAVGLDNMLEDQKDVRAPILVYPHHGGRPRDADPFEFSKKLCKAVKPSVVVFSLGRGIHKNPLPEVIAGVRAACPKAHIACTQLSEHCAAAVRDGQGAHLSNRPARGRPDMACCAGTIVVNPRSPKTLDEPGRPAHLRFIKKHVESPLCLRKPARS